jgi:hypothetical protein
LQAQKGFQAPQRRRQLDFFGFNMFFLGEQMHDNYAFRDKFCFACVCGEESECDINKPPFYHLKG